MVKMCNSQANYQECKRCELFDDCRLFDKRLNAAVDVMMEQVPDDHPLMGLGDADMACPRDES